MKSKPVFVEGPAKRRVGVGFFTEDGDSRFFWLLTSETTSRFVANAASTQRETGLGGSDDDWKLSSETS